MNGWSKAARRAYRYLDRLLKENRRLRRVTLAQERPAKRLKACGQEVRTP